jgi:hypothetical protein
VEGRSESLTKQIAETEGVIYSLHPVIRAPTGSRAGRTGEPTTATGTRLVTTVLRTRNWVDAVQPGFPAKHADRIWAERDGELGLTKQLGFAAAVRKYFFSLLLFVLLRLLPLLRLASPPPPPPPTAQVLLHSCSQLLFNPPIAAPFLPLRRPYTLTNERVPHRPDLCGGDEVADVTAACVPARPFHRP